MVNDESRLSEVRGDLLSGPVIVRVPNWATPDQVRQFEHYVEAANRWLARQREDAGKS